MATTISATSAIYDAYPGRVDYEDLMAGVDVVVDRGFVDTQRLYVQGCSGTFWLRYSALS